MCEIGKVPDRWDGQTPADESGSASAAMKCSMEVTAELSPQALSPQHPVFAQRCAPGCFGATFAQYRDQQATHLVAVGVLLLRWRLVGVLVLVVWLLALLRGPLRLVAMPILWWRLRPILGRWRSLILLWRVLLLMRRRRRLLILHSCAKRLNVQHHP